MKNFNKLKNFIKKTFFGEKMENALQKKNEIKKSLPIVESKTHFSAVNKTVRNDNPPLEKSSAVLSELPDKSKLNQINPTFEIRPNAENIAAFREIMESRFAENAKATQPLIRLGIDLGTSYSKVVWRLGEENVFPLCFGENKFDLADYLMPSLVGFENQTILFGNEALKSNYSISNFKMCLACESKKDEQCNIKKCSLTSWKTEIFTHELADEETEFVNSFFLAKLIAETKELIIKELISTHRFPSSVKPKWTANYSIPDTFIEQSEIAVSFRKVFRTAWFMTEVFIGNHIDDNLKSIVECYLAAKSLTRESNEILNDEEFGCSPYPEVGAEVASIVMSKTSEIGLYAFVDIGAGTIDTSIFRYFRDGKGAQRPPYAADVSRMLGAAQLEIRASKKSEISARKLKEIKENYKNLSELDRKKFTKEISSLKSASKEITEETIKSLKVVFRQAYEKEKNVERWKDLKLILGGGGSKLKCYREAGSQAFSLTESKNTIPPQITILPKPVDFQMHGLPETEFHRFSVAYGLTFDISKLPKVIFAKDVRPVKDLKLKRKFDRDADR